MQPHSLDHRQRGFTLIEVLIVVVIVGILAAVAYPSFVDSIRKSRRSEAMSALTAIQLAQERYRSNQPTYADSLAKLKQTAVTESGRYTLELRDVGPTSYTAVAIPASGSSQLKDGDCAQLGVQMNAGNLSHSAAAAGDPLSANDRCWAK